jgi:pyrimidine deaminase RibD-like protein
MRLAIELSKLCPTTTSAYSVGAVLISEEREIARGYSRETGEHEHAEEIALRAAGVSADLTNATLYSTLEPCSQRASKPLSCTELILEAKIPRVVIAWREPSIFVPDCIGVETLRQHGVLVTELDRLKAEAMRVNAHVLAR